MWLAPERLGCDGDGSVGHIRGWVVNRAGVPQLWVTRHSGRQYEEYPSLVDGVRCIGTENPRDFRGLAREIAACFPIDLLPLVSGVKTKLNIWIRTFRFAAVQFLSEGQQK